MIVTMSLVLNYIFHKIYTLIISEVSSNITGHSLNDLEVLYLSHNFVVVNKQPDLVINTDLPDKYPVSVHSQLKHKFPNLANNFLKHDFWFCHRLDFATSGVMCIALNKKASVQAYHAFSKRTTQKYYLALLRGVVSSEALTITAKVGEDLQNQINHKMCTGNKDYCGKMKTAETKLLVLRTGIFCNYPATEVLLKPMTGRRHQLRVHCNYIGHTIIGDYTYSNRKDVLPERTYLHAYKLIIPNDLETINIKTVYPFQHDFQRNWVPIQTLNDINSESVFDVFNDESKFNIHIT